MKEMGRFKIKWPVMISATFLTPTVLVYLLHYAIFHNAHDIFFYMIMDIGFLPIQVLLVTLVINRMLSEREKRIRMEKLNMVIGAFFSEAGTRLLRLFSSYDPAIGQLRETLLVGNHWSDKEFAALLRQLRHHEHGVDLERADLEELQRFLIDKRGFLLRLIENPNLLEHEDFTDLLRAVFHLTEELECRTAVDRLSPADRAHIANDIKRAYSLMIREWLAYMRHLKNRYPYLFSLAIRLNPFNPEAAPEIQS
jgi:hypothetical protein